MYAIVRYSTDLRDRNYRLEFTQSRSRAEGFAGLKPRFSHKNPEEARNHHHDFAEVYVMPHGWRRPSKKVISTIVFKERGSIYSPNSEEILYRFVRKDGIRLGAEVPGV